MKTVKISLEIYHLGDDYRHFMMSDREFRKENGKIRTNRAKPTSINIERLERRER